MKKLVALMGIVGLLGLNSPVVFAAADPLAPTITSVNPQTGPTSGGTTITITGTNFVVGSTTVTIGAVPTANTVVAEDGLSLTTETVEMGPAAEDIVVTTPHGSALLEAGFRFSTSTPPAGTSTPPTSTSTPSATHTITYLAGMNGTLSGSTTQVVADGGSGSAVTATGNQWFTFSNWDDGSTSNPRTDTGVTADHTYTANFISSSQQQPCNGSTFDTFATGSVNGQGGWHVSGDFDQEIVPNTFGFATFGCQALRFSDAVTSPFIYNQTFSYTGDNEAGETDAVGGDNPVGTRQNHFEAQFDLASVMHDEQPGMHISVSADRGDGTRMSALSFADTAVGIDAFFTDVTGTSSPVTFNDTQIAWNLNRTVPHTVKLVMDFVDGDSNDVVKVYIDGALVHTGTSWENFYRYDNDAFPAPNNMSRTVTSLSFSELGGAHTANRFGGYLVDNVTLGTSIIPDLQGDTTAPVITLNGSSTMSVLQNGTFIDPGATAHDDFDGYMSVQTTGTVDTSTLGSYVLTYTATDTAHNTASTTRTVNVVASSTEETTATTTATTTLPTITLNGATPMQVTLNDAFTDPGATAHDVFGNALTVATSGTVNTTIVGPYTITYTATDSNNNTASTTRTVNVVAGAGVGGGGGGGGGSSSGGGYFIYSPQTGGNGQITVTPVTSVVNPITVSLLPTSSVGQVLGVTSVNFGRNLKFGMTGEDILALQTLLKTGGYLVINVPTNYFGGKTMAALKKWQKAHGLPATGFFGPMSRALLNKS
jgi:hypothetical protein